MKTREQLVNFYKKRLEKVKASWEGMKAVTTPNNSKEGYIEFAENQLQDAKDGKLDYYLTSNILKTFI